MVEKVSSFKERFNEALSIRNIKPIELSERTGLSESTISQYRSGYAKPKDEKLVLLSNVLGVNPVWLMGLNVPMEETEKEQPEISLNYDTEKIAEAMDLYNVYKNASPEVKQAIDALLKVAQSVPKVPQLDVPRLKSDKPRAEVPHLKKDTE